MLRELFVQNLALIEDVQVELHPGFCAWTGETGAGKSLLLGGLGLLLGERGSSELIRTGAEELRITGRFELTSPVKQAIERLLETTFTENEVLLSRRLNRTGRSGAYVNDQPVAVNTLKQIGEMLVDIHGQRESELLLQPAYQLQLLDAYGHLQHQRQNYLDRAEQVRVLRKRLNTLTAERQQRQRELSLIRFEREELDKADLQKGELPELQQERQRLANAQSLMALASGGYDTLYDEEGSVVERIGKVQREAEQWIESDSRLQEVVQRLDDLRSQVQDVAQSLHRLGETWEADPMRLEEVERRIVLLKRLESKYGKTVDELVDYRAGLDEQEQRLQQQETDLEGTEGELTTAYQKLKQAATELSKKRGQVAKKLAAETQKHLADLGMREAKLETVLEPVPLGPDTLKSEIPAFGADQLELMLAANPGEPSRPLRKVASGGEMSRTMLALKTVLAEHDQMSTLVFDEIDANVGGRLGDVLGQKLAALGQTHQVICVTHLPQVASYARYHWTIRKKKKANRTTTSIQALTDGERLEELASMLRGEARGETTMKEAAAMLQAARRRW